MNLAFIPLYIKYLGIEAYGLIGLFALLQAWLSLLDMGMTPTLSREMARFTAGENSTKSIRDLLRSIEIISIIIAISIMIFVWLISDWLASDWLKSDKIPNEIVAQAFSIMGVVAALRFVENIYRSTVIGLQKQVEYNVFNSIISTFRVVGAVLVLMWVSKTIEAFFLWQGIISLTTLISMSYLTYKFIPSSGASGKFSLMQLKRIRKFTGGLFLIMLLSVLYSHSDKLILSTTLSLTELGFYMLAFSVAGILHQLITPVTQAVYPKFCEHVSEKDVLKFADLFHLSSQVVTIVSGGFTILMVFNSKLLLYLWTQDAELSSNVSPILTLLIIAVFLSGLIWIPYQAQLAYGWTKFSIVLNTITLLVMMPTIYYSSEKFGAIGAAFALIIVSLIYWLIGIRFMFSFVLKDESYRWYFDDILKPILAGVGIAIVFKFVSESFLEANIFMQLLYLVMCFLFILLAMSLSSSRIKKYSIMKALKLLKYN